MPLVVAVDRFLDRFLEVPTTGSTYAGTLARLLDLLGDTFLTGDLSREQVEAVMTRWNASAANMWNKRLSARPQLLILGRHDEADRLRAVGKASSLGAVTARSNRQMSDQHPAEWLPSSADALCRDGVEWTATKLRWGLAVDELGRDRLLDIAAGCGGTDVEFTPRPVGGP
ncbi:hypothetical protein [Streptomyces sp. NPDC054838]